MRSQVQAADVISIHIVHCAWWILEALTGASPLVSLAPKCFFFITCSLSEPQMHCAEIWVSSLKGKS